MKYLLIAKVITYSDPIEIEAESLEEAKEMITEEIDAGIIEIESSQELNVEFDFACPDSPHGHRPEKHSTEDYFYCHYCGKILKGI